MKYFILSLLTLTCSLSLSKTEFNKGEDALKKDTKFISLCDRTEKISYEILQKLKYKTKNESLTCDQVTPEDLKKLDRLTVRFISKKLKSYDLSGLVNLKKLHFDSNDFSVLPEDLLEELHSLEEIQFIFHFNLKTIPENFLRNQKKLKTFFKGKHRVSNWPSKLFDHNLELEKVHIQDGLTKAFDPDFLTPVKLPNLKKINICEWNHLEENQNLIKHLFKDSNVRVEFRHDYEIPSNKDSEFGCVGIA